MVKMMMAVKMMMCNRTGATFVLKKCYKKDISYSKYSGFKKKSVTPASNNYCPI